MGLYETIVGRKELQRTLRDLGYDVRPASEQERGRLGSGWLAPDRHCLVVSGRPFDIISLRIEGWVGPWDSLRHGAGSVTVGRIPVSSRRVLPLRTHFVLLCAPARAVPALDARLHLRREGIIRRRVLGCHWEGQRLAAILNMDRETIADLRRTVGPSERLRVEPDPGHGCVRVVHHSTRVLDYSLFKKDLVSFHQQLAPPRLLRAIERVAAAARRYIDERLPAEP